MGVFRDLARGLKPSAVKQGLAASREVLKGGYAGPTEEQLASLTPAQRADYALFVWDPDGFRIEVFSWPRSEP